MLRHIFGTKNYLIEESLEVGLLGLEVSKELKVPCQINKKVGEQVYLVMDGQYVKFMNEEDVLLAGPLPVNSLTVYEDGTYFEIVDKTLKGEFFSANIEDPLHQYVSKEIKWRKRASMEIELALRTLRFPFE